MIAKTTAVVAEGLKAQPLALALVVINILFLTGGGWLLMHVAERAEQRDTALIAMARDCANRR